MSRKSGVVLTEDLKALMRERRRTNRSGQRTPFLDVMENLKHLSYWELNDFIVQAEFLLKTKSDK